MPFRGSNEFRLPRTRRMGPLAESPPVAMIGKDGKTIEAKEVDLPFGFEAVVAAKWIPKLDTPKLVADMSGG